MRKNDSPRPQAGFALLEALISILLFSIGVLGIVALQARASQFSVDSEDRTRAAMLTNEIVSQMWAQASTGIDCASVGSSRTDLDLPGRTVSCSTDSTSGVVTIKVTWKAPWRKSAEQDNTYLTQVLIP